MNIISAKHLSKQYHYYKKQPGLTGSIRSIFVREKLVSQAVKDVSFSIKQGEFVGFLGPNGAGKTTTLKMLSGIIFPTSGEAKVLGYDPTKRQKHFLKEFALVMGQKNQLIKQLPAWDNFNLKK